MLVYYIGIALAIIFGTTIAIILNRSVHVAINANNPLSIWDLIHSCTWLPLTLRHALFIYLVRINSPFLKAIDFNVDELGTGRVVARMKATKKVSNLYGTVHAGAMVTFAETLSAMALFSYFQPRDRAMATSLTIDYFKKSNGILTATSTVPEIKDFNVKDVKVDVIVTNAKSETVAKLTATFRTDFRSRKTE
ncbi:hypothetical protein FBU30_002524 [Linnemannia zychae]|nr:hypothetical protein FBU30_002524 [Linnemannia zychae]